jgi:hypothetical protein
MKAFAMGNDKGKAKELSPQDAALLIQMNYRAHLAHRSQVLRCLRDLAVAKAKLKELRSMFYNLNYRRRCSYDHEERQRFSEKIIVLLLTVDALEVSSVMACLAFVICLCCPVEIQLLHLLLSVCTHIISARRIKTHYKDLLLLPPVGNKCR